MADALNGGAVLIARGRRSHSTACSYTINGTAVEAIFDRKSADPPLFSIKIGILLPPRPLPLASQIAAGVLYFAIFICNTFLLFVAFFYAFQSL